LNNLTGLVMKGKGIEGSGIPCGRF